MQSARPFCTSKLRKTNKIRDKVHIKGWLFVAWPIPYMKTLEPGIADDDED